MAESESEKLPSAKERQRIGGLRGSEVSRALRAGELEKLESGRYKASKEYMEKARKEMGLELERERKDRADKKPEPGAKIDKNHPDFERPWDLDPEKMTVEEIELQIGRAKRDNYLPGVTPLGLSYWEKQLENAKKRVKTEADAIIEAGKAVKERQGLERVEAAAEKERGQAEEKRKDIDKIDLQIKQARIQLKNLSEEEEKRKREPGVGVMEQTKIEKEFREKRKLLEKEYKELEEQKGDTIKKEQKEGWGAGFKKSAVGFYEKSKEKAREKWPFWRERLKGAVTAGGLEYYHAEKFRRATKETGKEAREGAEELKPEDVVNVEDVKKELAKNGIENSTNAQVGKIFKSVVLERALSNQRVEDEIVKNSLEQLKKRLEKYISTAGVAGIPPEKLQEIETRLRGKLKEIRSGQAEKDIVNYAKIFRDGFDIGESGWTKWKMRYVYGALETALAFLGFTLLYEWWKKGGGATPLVEGGAGPAPESMPGPGSVVPESAVPGPASEIPADLMDRTVWNTIKEVGKEDFGANLSNKDLVDLSKEVVKNPKNHIGVKIWKILGSPFDTQMHQGHLLYGIRDAISRHLIGKL